MSLIPEDIIKLLLAILAGGLIGAEREYRNKAAGFRTIIFICVGATIFTILSVKIGGEAESARIAANIVSGVGFLGAGVILRGSGRIVGLTTASTIWLAAAIGMGIGADYFQLTATAVGLVLIVLWIFPSLEKRIDDLSHVVDYEIVCAIDEDIFAGLKETFTEKRLRVKAAKRNKVGNRMICSIVAQGSPKNHERLVKALFENADVKEFRT